MASNRKSDASRANGARSQGPVTPEGKARSSVNAMRHGLSSKKVVIAGESSEDYQALLDSYIEEFQPHSGFEAELVHTMAASRWRLRRLTAIESSIFEMELIRRRKDIDTQFTETIIENRIAFIFQKLADYSNTPAMLLRYEGTLTRTHDRAFKQLLALQARRRKPELTQPRSSAETTPGDSESHALPAESQHPSATDDTESACVQNPKLETPANPPDRDASSELSSPSEDVPPIEKTSPEPPQGIANPFQKQPDPLDSLSNLPDPHRPLA